MPIGATRVSFDITEKNLFVELGDLIGIRILHLHTRQFEQIDKALRAIFKERKYRLVERPFARTWDDEYRGYFRSLGIKVQASPTMYTSVHYSIEPVSRTKIVCEIQVRTLMEEVWGEVDHTFNYPDPIQSVACGEQIQALARVTSSATRLVDAIFATVEDIHSRKPRTAARR
jgi:putative GTP pyrophosphokinase